MVGFKKNKKLMHCQASLHKRRGWWGAPPPVCKHNARMVTGGVSKRLILCMASFKNDSQAVKQACTRLKTRGGGGGLGAGASPPICKHNARMVGFKKTQMLSSKLSQARGWWGAAPTICKHTARMVNGNASKLRLTYDSIISLSPSSPPPLSSSSSCTSSCTSSACACQHA